MTKRNPLLQTQFIKKEFNDYIKSTFIIKDQIYNQHFREQLENFDLARGPYLSVALPFSNSTTISNLIRSGKLEPDFLRLGGISNIADRKLYVHQSQALHQISSGNNVVITTGTGSGKTECYLYPIINHILKEINSGDNSDGVRAFLLFPMNALINDQMSRLRSLLATYPEIRFGFFTGETENFEASVSREELSNYYGEPIPPNEIISREQMRNKPPHILFTNYSMLEYLLLRPNDHQLLKPESMTKWQFMVMDEAHTYRGALGIEVAMLIKRLISRAQKRPQFILTSATLGKGNQDIDKIISFAETLTSGNYSHEDIIFATRDSYDYSLATTYQNPILYHKLISNLESPEKIGEILHKDNCNNENIAEFLYDFLKTDKTVTHLIKATSKAILFQDMLLSLQAVTNIKSDDLVALIELLSIASKNNKPLMDIKYHMFIRAPEGAFVTLGSEKEFRLINSKKINDKKAFNIGICKYCKSTYVFGKIANNILEQNEDVDISESFDEIDQFHVEYFIIPDGLTKSELDNLQQNEDIVPYVICTKCGHIYDRNNLRAVQCNCGNDYQKLLYKVPSSHQVTTCPVCESSNSSQGIVDPFHIGKDSATALLAQILYQALDLSDPTKVDIEILDDDDDNFFEHSPEINVSNKPVRQFLAFSDSRQQAAFFAKFFSYNDDRFLKKASLYHACELENNLPIRVANLTSIIGNLYRDNGLYENDDERLVESRLAILLELLKVDGRNSAENKGLYAFVPDIPIEKLTDKILMIFNQRNDTNLTKEQLIVLMKIGLEIFRIVPAISYPPFNDMKRPKEVLGYRSFYNYMSLEINRGGRQTDRFHNVKSFIPITNTNSLLDFIKKSLKLTTDNAKNFMRDLWMIYIKFALIKSPQFEEKYQINMDNYSLYGGKAISWFVCDLCGTITHLNYENQCPNGDCVGRLVPINPDVYFADEYYRYQFKTKKIELVRVEEHTAQLSPQQARLFQSQFKDKQINILSSSTTFEMGVDIGLLSTVFLRNMPPLPSNYVQRAGRAGRRSDISALILTYCNNTSHDFTYFKYPDPMISGDIRPPYFLLDNLKIVNRHINAVLLGEFFLKYPLLIESMDSFLTNNGSELFEDFINSTLPEPLIAEIENQIIPNELTAVLGDGKWLAYIRSSDNLFKLMTDSIKDLIDMYEKSYDIGAKNHDTKLMQHCETQIRDIKLKTPVIAHLSRYNVIPRYGFPIDNVDLKIYNPQTRVTDERYRLNRDLSIAISEYAPDSDVIVDQNIYTSRYIVLPPSQGLPRFYYHECPHCHRINVNELPFSQTHVCNYCKQSFSLSGENLSFIIPKFGFYADYRLRNTTRQKPRRTFAGEIIYIGHGKLFDEEKTINKHIKISRYKDDEMLIINANNFYMCDSCGYTELKRDLFAPYYVSKKDHQDHRGAICTNRHLNHVALGNKYRTDVAIIDIDIPMDRTGALSTLYALLEGISTAFQIERRDINGVINNKDNSTYQFVIFDTIPGGAGHTANLMDPQNLLEAVKAAYNVVNGDCCDEDTSCYSCLRNYYNQRIHSELIRGAAKRILESLLD